jgi:hypothetical protein
MKYQAVLRCLSEDDNTDIYMSRFPLSATADALG